MLISDCSRPRLGIGPLIGVNSSCSLVALSSRKRFGPGRWSGRQNDIESPAAPFPGEPGKRA